MRFFNSFSGKLAETLIWAHQILRNTAIKQWFNYGITPIPSVIGPLVVHGTTVSPSYNEYDGVM